MIRQHVRLIIVPLALVAVALFTANTVHAAIVGTPFDDNLIIQGTLGPYNETLTNAYSGATFTTSGTYNVNNETYDGLGGVDVLYMSNSGDVMTLRNASNIQTLFNTELIIAGRGNDVIDLSDPTFVIDAVVVDGGDADDVIWANVGDDYLYGRHGDDNLDGGPGADTLIGGSDISIPGVVVDGVLMIEDADVLRGGPGNDFLDGGVGDDIYKFGLGDGWDKILDSHAVVMDEIHFDAGITLADLVITPIDLFTLPGDGIHDGNGQYEILVGNGGDKIEVGGVELLRFNDGTTFLMSSVPEPSTYAMATMGLLGFFFVARRRRKR